MLDLPMLIEVHARRDPKKDEKNALKSASLVVYSPEQGRKKVVRQGYAFEGLLSTDGNERTQMLLVGILRARTPHL